jgi:pyruvate,water dikinase
MRRYIRFFEEIAMKDVPQVGGKNASLGELWRHLAPQGVKLPNGFATTADAYFHFLDEAGLTDKIHQTLDGLDVTNLDDLAERGAAVRAMIVKAKLPADFEAEIRTGYAELSKLCGHKEVTVAVRSSATAEDLPNASFAGEQETYLNVTGADAVIKKTVECIASLFTNRAIVYRAENGFDHLRVALSVGVQQMVALKSRTSGIMFTIDTETGFHNVVVINAIYGQGENIVQGRVSPDEFTVFKPTMAIIKRRLGAKQSRLLPAAGGKMKNTPVPTAERARYCLSDEQVKTLAGWGMAIEKHYGKPMDMEWAQDDADGQLYIVQARPETVAARRDTNVIENYHLLEKAVPTVTGVSVGDKIGAGPVNKITGIKDMGHFKQGDVLVTEMTDPDWVPIMKMASAIVTDKGGRTCHAAIVSRELGIPCVVGTGDGVAKLKQGEEVTVSCAEGDEGHIYVGKLKFVVDRTDVAHLPRPKTKIMMNVGSPDLAFEYAQIPNDGVGLAREEFIIDSHIKIHPMALLKFDQVKDKAARATIEKLTAGYADKAQYFVDKLAEGVAVIAAAFWPNDVIIRFSDFRTNEYAGLIGGAGFEPAERNPMIGWRGASRYYDPGYQPAFELECQAMLKVRDELGLTNVKAMIPFCRTLEEAKKVLAVMAGAGLKRGENGFEVYVMAEIPSNIILAEQFAELFDGFSIGSNDLTQMTLGVDRDNSAVAIDYDENNEAVKELIRRLIKVGKDKHVKVGICGQAPSDYPEFARFLVEEGIDSISLTPDTVVKTTIDVKKTEDKLKK